MGAPILGYENKQTNKQTNKQKTNKQIHDVERKKDRKKEREIKKKGKIEEIKTKYTFIINFFPVFFIPTHPYHCPCPSLSLYRKASSANVSLRAFIFVIQTMKGELLINQIYAYSQIEVPSPTHCAVPTPAHYVVNPRSLNNFFFFLFSARIFSLSVWTNCVISSLPRLVYCFSFFFTISS